MDDVDRAIVHCLRRDARMSNVALARELGVSEKTVRNRITRLLGSRAVRLDVKVTEDGRPTRLLLLVQAEPGRRFEVARALAERVEVDHIHLTTGAYDIALVASFPDGAAALEFVVRAVEGRADVQSAESCHLISEVHPTGESGSATDSPAVDTELIGAFLLRRPGFATSRHLLDEACALALDGLHADRALASIFAGPSPADGLLATRYRGLSQAYVAETIRRAEREKVTTVVSRVVATGRPALIADCRTDPLMAWAADLVLSEGYITLLTVPMMHGKRVVGVLSVYLDKPTHVSDSYVATTQALADHLGIAWGRLDAPSAP
ncbi:AsnC family transcriptional regulator [Streptomyces lunalinharesii]|uniref:HTH asnC-type domain-containing protein n=1 Tax=Streptomyces lunalinharesii TaxID=333384 RepID=A0ABP6F2S8_9ACTN